MGADVQSPFVGKFTPNGLSDALFMQADDQNAQIGGCLLLQNVVPARGARGTYAPRPGVGDTAYITWANAPGTGGGTGITTDGFVVAMLTLGSRVFAMIEGHNGGTYYDMPACWDTSTGAFVAITGFTTANCPKDTGYPNGGGAGSVAADWTPVVMCQVGSKIIVCHQGFLGTGNYIGWIDLGTMAWSAGNLTGALSFTVPPLSVTQFNGRAYYAVGGSATSNNVIFSDSLNAINCTNATQVLTVGDNQPVLGFGQQPYNSTSAGGIIQSILPFKANSIAQISGDSTTSNLLVNVIATGIGTKAPQTIASTPLGVMFMAQDGVRYVDPYGKISPPLPGLRIPFINANALAGQCFPSTATAAFNSGMYRISLYTTDQYGNIQRVEYVYDFEYGWHGPHRYSPGTGTGFAPLLYATLGAAFVFTYRRSNPTITSGTQLTYLSQLLPGPLDAQTDNSDPVTWTLLSCALDDGYPMLAKNLVEATLAYNPGNVNGNISVSFVPTPVGTNSGSSQPAGDTETMSYTAPGSLWGTAVWGAFQWGGSALSALSEATIPLDSPVAYKGLQFGLSGTAALNQRIGSISYRGEIPGQTNLDLST